MDNFKFSFHCKERRFNSVLTYGLDFLLADYETKEMARVGEPVQKPLEPCWWGEAMAASSANSTSLIRTFRTFVFALSL